MLMTMLIQSEEAHKLFLRALENCDSDRIAEMIESNVEGVKSGYICWDEFDAVLGNSADGIDSKDLSAILVAGAELAERARADGKVCVVLPCDGNGCHYFMAASERQLVEALAVAASVLEEETAEARSMHDAAIVQGAWDDCMRVLSRDAALQEINPDLVEWDVYSNKERGIADAAAWAKTVNKTAFPVEGPGPGTLILFATDANTLAGELARTAAL